MKKYILLFLLAACSSPNPLPLVEKVDLNRYAGKWYEIARLPLSFQKDCQYSWAIYTPREDGNIDVLNRCQTAKGLEEAKGIARVVAGSQNAALEVSFFRPFWGDYQIMALDKDYQSVMVGTPNRKYLWILSRRPHLDAQTYQQYLQQAEQAGFDLTPLITDIYPENL